MKKEISIKAILDLDSIGIVWEVLFFKSICDILFPIGDNKMLSESFVNNIFPVLCTEPHKLVN